MGWGVGGYRLTLGGQNHGAGGWGWGGIGSHSRPVHGLKRQDGFWEERIRFLKTQMSVFDPGIIELGSPWWGVHLLRWGEKTAKHLKQKENRTQVWGGSGSCGVCV